MRYFDEGTLQNIKAYALKNIHLYSKNTNEWVTDYLEDDSNITNHSLKMKFSSEVPSNYDFYNSKILYELYKDIPVELASEESFWSYLAHTEFWEYMIIR